MVGSSSGGINQRTYRRSDECLFAVLPVLTGLWIMKRFIQCGPKLVDRLVEAENSVSFDILSDGLRQCSKEDLFMGGGSIQIFGMIESVLARREVLRVMPSARMRTNCVNAAPAILQEWADDVLRGVLEWCERKNFFGVDCQTNH